MRINSLEALKKAIQKNKTEKIKYISIIDGKLGGADGCQDLTKILKQHYFPALTDLDLSNNAIGDEGAQYFDDAFANMPKLSWLNLENNAITAAGITKIAIGLQSAILPALGGINLEKNPIGDEGAKLLIDAVVDSPLVQFIYIAKEHKGGASPVVQDKLAQMLNDNAKLKSLVQEQFDSTIKLISFFREEEEAVLFHYICADYLYHQNKFQAALEQCSFAMYYFNPTAKNLNMFKAARYAIKENDTINPYTQEAVVQANTKVFKKLINPDKSEIYIAKLQDIEKLPLKIFSALETIMSESLESTDVQALGVDEYKSDEA